MGNSVYNIYCIKSSRYLYNYHSFKFSFITKTVEIILYHYCLYSKFFVTVYNQPILTGFTFIVYYN